MSRSRLLHRRALWRGLLPALMLPAPLLLSGAARAATGAVSTPSGTPWVQQSFAPVAARPGRTVPGLTGAKAIAHLKATGQYESLGAAITGARYGVHPIQGDATRAWAQNPAHGLNSTFTPQGLRFTVRVPAQATEKATAYAGAWRLQSLGYGAAQKPVPAGTLRTAGQRVELVRRAPAITEWFNNAPTGLEHGFTLSQRPAANPRGAALRLVLAVSGGLVPQADAAGQSLALRDAAGHTVLTYAKLKVWDARGTALPASLQVAQGQITISVVEAAAHYPLTIDPTFAQQAYLKASNSSASDLFGFSVAVAGDTVVVGANSEAGSGAAYAFVRSGTTWSQQAYLKASNPGGSDFFGTSVAVAGDTIVVGAPYEDSDATGVNGDQTNNNAKNSGAAYVFVRSGTTWSQQAYLKASNPEGFDFFGTSVAVAGDTVVVGAPYEASNATGVNGSQTNNSAFDSGAAYAFVRTFPGGIATWSQQAYLKASDTRENDVFGTSVAAAGDTVVVGAPCEDVNNVASGSGAAYVFVRSGTTWSQQALLKASNPQRGDYFGLSVAVAGDTVVAGAYGEDSNATGVNGTGTDPSTIFNSGAAYVFARSGTAWSQQAYLKASNTGQLDIFGLSVAVAGDTVVVGAFGEDSNATGINGNQSNNSASSSGAAYVFARSGMTWSQQAYLKASNTEADDFFGTSVAVAGDTVVVGASDEDSNAKGVNGDQSNNSASSAGAAYVFAPAPPGLLQLSAGTYSVSEGGATATITVTRSAGSSGAVSVDYATSDGTATAPGDYTATSGTLNWADGDSAAKTFSIPISNDALDEPDETVALALSNPAGGATIGSPQNATLTITDDDPPPTFSINDVTMTEGNSGTANATFTVSLVSAAATTVTVHYATSDGTATQPADYGTSSGTLTFTSGQLTQTLTVPIVGDVFDEANENFKVTLSGAVGAGIADNLGIGTIKDNDPAPIVSINDVTVTEGDAGTVNAVFHINLSAPSNRTVTVTYVTANGTATAGSDYVAHPQTTLTFTPGQTSKTVIVLVNGDTADEANETFKVVLQAATNAAIPDTKGVGSITDDDPLPSVAISDVTAVVEGDSGAKNALFTVTLTGLTNRTVTVSYTTADGTAQQPGDYTAKTGTITFTPGGATSKTLPVPVVGDVLGEADETFKVNLTGASFAIISDSQGIGTITDDD